VLGADDLCMSPETVHLGPGAHAAIADFVMRWLQRARLEASR
jgi:hypothetical protein